MDNSSSLVCPDNTCADTEQPDAVRIYSEQQKLEAETSVDPADVCSKAKEYVARMREAAVAAVQAKFAHDHI